MIFFSKKKKSGLGADLVIPKHIGIIMDGNGRWAKRRSLPKSVGHKAGADTLKKIIEYCEDIGIEAVTVYAFSTENWKRPQKEVDYLMNLMYGYLKDSANLLTGRSARIRIIGSVEQLSQKMRDEIIKTEESTKDNKGIRFNLAINYGGREEITNATKNIVRDIKAGKITEDQIDDKLISQYMYTDFLPDPDVIIRTSGEYRLSNFMLWQAAYSEFWYTNVLWPDFSHKEIDKMIEDYNKRERRFGGRNDEEE